MNYLTDLGEVESTELAENGYRIIQSAGSPHSHTRKQTQNGVEVTLASTRKVDRAVGRYGGSQVCTIQQAL